MFIFYWTNWVLLLCCPWRLCGDPGHEVVRNLALFFWGDESRDLVYFELSLCSSGDITPCSSSTGHVGVGLRCQGRPTRENILPLIFPYD
jgi:hypothetical protein